VNGNFWNRAGGDALSLDLEIAARHTSENAMDAFFKARYAERGRSLEFMGFAVDKMHAEELYAVIGFLLERVDDDSTLELKQEAPLGAPHSDPPKMDGLFEG
jgi:hypothetical protein